MSRVTGKAVQAQFRNHPAFLAAQARGDRTFEPGFPCWYGHNVPRLVGHLQKCVRCCQIISAVNEERRRIREGGTPSKKKFIVLEQYPTGHELFALIHGDDGK